MYIFIFIICIYNIIYLYIYIYIYQILSDTYYTKFSNSQTTKTTDKKNPFIQNRYAASAGLSSEIIILLLLLLLLLLIIIIYFSLAYNK